MRCMHEFDTLRTCSLYSASAMLQFQRGDFEELGFGGAPQCFLSRSPRGSFRGHDEGNLIGRNNKRIGMKQTPGCAGTAGELPGRSETIARALPSLIHPPIAPSRHRVIASSRHRAIAPSRHRSPTRQAVRHVDPRRGHPPASSRHVSPHSLYPHAVGSTSVACGSRLPTTTASGVRWHRLPPRERAPAPSTAAPFQARRPQVEMADHETQTTPLSFSDFMRSPCGDKQGIHVIQLYRTTHDALDAPSGSLDDTDSATDRSISLTSRLPLYPPQASLLVCNAGAVLNEKRVLNKCTTHDTLIRYADPVRLRKPAPCRSRNPPSLPPPPQTALDSPRSARIRWARTTRVHSSSKSSACSTRPRTCGCRSSSPTLSSSCSSSSSADQRVC